MLEAGPQVPESRELRLHQGITQGWLEDNLYRAYSGGNDELVGAIAETEILLAEERIKAAEGLAFLLHQKMAENSFGNVNHVDVTEAVRLFAENEILDLHPERQAPGGMVYDGTE